LGKRELFPEKSPKELLAQFKETGANAPFEEIVRRYAAMVYGVCLRVTGDKHDAEDATQAVFLSLALQAKTDREITYIGPWLQKVAHRLALDVKKSKTRRKKREDKLADETRHAMANANGNGHANGNGNGANGYHPAFTGGNGHGLNPADAPGNEELKSIMMEELNQLPAKYRMPLVMHYFGGLSREEMSEQLGCNPSTLGVRVHRGKAMLGTRLKKRGIAISAIAMVVVLEHVIKATALKPIVAGSSVAAGSAGAGLMAYNGGGATSAAMKVIAIIRTAGRAVAFAKLKTAVVVGLLIISAAVSAPAQVRKFVVENIRIPLPRLDMSRWIKPLFQNLLPSLRADSGESSPLDERPEETLTATPQPLPMNVDPSRFYGGTNLPPPPARVASIEPAPTPTVKPAAPAPVELAQAETMPWLDMVVNPPSLRTGASAFAHSEVKPTAIGSDAPPKSNDASDKSEKPTVVASNSGDLNLGAGGGGGAGGKPDVYVLPENQALHNGNVTVGDAGNALFRNLGGNHSMESLTVGKQKGSTGTYEHDGGIVSARVETIGDNGEGSYILKQGVNIVDQTLTVGRNGAGYYRQSGGDTIIAMSPSVDDATRGLHIGENAGSVGTFVLDGGGVEAATEVVGNHGDGTFIQNDGVNKTSELTLGSGNGGRGDYKLLGGKLVLVDPSGEPASSGTIRIGDNGYGSFQFGNSSRTGFVASVGDGSVVVRGKATGDGMISGHGKIALPGTLKNNSQVAADGYGKNRTLDLSSFSTVTSDIENNPWNGAGGWFARRKGRLLLPSIPVQKGTHTYTWGEDENDSLIDLVNSVRLTVNDAQNDGDVTLALLSPLRDDIPTLPDGHKFIGIWSFDGSELGGFDGLDVQVRYDDAMADTLGLNEHLLKLWEYDPTAAAWRRLDGEPTFARDTLNHILSGHIGGGATYFAVSAPEPGTAMLVIVAGAAMLRRRRRKVLPA
jgi:RNA polymerase sigma factor (sigma-70 family)